MDALLPIKGILQNADWMDGLTFSYLKFKNIAL